MVTETAWRWLKISSKYYQYLFFKINFNQDDVNILDQVENYLENLAPATQEAAIFEPTDYGEVEETPREATAFRRAAAAAAASEKQQRTIRRRLSLENIENINVNETIKTRSMSRSDKEANSY